jgi:hypothetical protein
MNETELEKRKARAANETLVIVPTEGGFRVYNPSAIANLYMVSGIPDLPKCNCPDFESHKSDPEWRCKHVLAVLNQQQGKEQQPIKTAEVSQEPEQKQNNPQLSEPAEKKKSRPARESQRPRMLIKRSISPDGKINSLSIEFSNPIDWSAEEEIKQQAKRALMLEAEIVKNFLQTKVPEPTKSQIPERPNGSGIPSSQSQANSNGAGNAVPAQLLNVAGMNTRSGWRLFIGVQVNGATLKLFGTKRQLGDYVAAAGFASIADHLSEGMMLNLPCRVVTKPSQDGKYVNVEQVLPLKPLENSGRAGK